jgi:hypothetical protein
MGTEIHIELPRDGLGERLQTTLGAQGFRAEMVDDGDVSGLRVQFSDERERLLVEVTHAIEGWLAESELPLVVERADGGCVLRPPGD